MMGTRSSLSSFSLGILAKTPCWNFNKQPRDGEKDGGPRALQIGEEGLDALGEKHAQAENQCGHLEACALHDVRQRQIR